MSAGELIAGCQRRPEVIANCVAGSLPDHQATKGQTVSRYTVKITFHPDDCDCERSPECRGKYVVNTPGAHTNNRIRTSVDDALESAREFLEERPE